MKKLTSRKKKETIVPSVLFLCLLSIIIIVTIEEVIQQKERKHAQESKKNDNKTRLCFFSLIFLTNIELSHKINTIKIWKMYLRLKEYRQYAVLVKDVRKMDVEEHQLMLFVVLDHIQAFFQLIQTIVDDLVHHKSYNAKQNSFKLIFQTIKYSSYP
jgi:hypothetical protein